MNHVSTPFERDGVPKVPVGVPLFWSKRYLKRYHTSKPVATGFQAVTSTDVSGSSLTLAVERGKSIRGGDTSGLSPMWSA